MVSGFYWLIEGVLAGCARPGGRHGGPDAVAALDQDLARLRAGGIGALLSLTETALDPDVLPRHGLDMLHIPVPDLTAPTPDQFLRALGFIDLQRSMGRAVAVHCLVGQGRTGTVLAAYLIRGGKSADAAIAHVRMTCPGAIGSPEQERALHAFAVRRDWIV